MAHPLRRIAIGDDPSAWRAAGFDVLGNELRLGKVVIELVGSAGQRGFHGWAIDGVTTDIEHIPRIQDPPEQQTEALAETSSSSSLNAIFAIDHVVVTTNDVARTVASFERVGLQERRTTTTSTPMGERRQSFLWAGRVIIEVIGPVDAELADRNDGHASIWGLALVASNLQVTSQVLDSALSEPRDAVQPGRKIATMRTKELDISVPIVVMSPHVAELL